MENTNQIKIKSLEEAIQKQMNVIEDHMKIITHKKEEADRNYLFIKSTLIFIPFIYEQEENRADKTYNKIKNNIDIITKKE